MDLLSDPFFYAMAIPAILLTGISKGGFAGGLGALGVPIMALAIPPLQAAAIMLPILIVMDWVGLWSYRGQWNKRATLALIPGSALGIFVGWLMADIVQDAHVRLVVGTIAILFSINHWTGGRIFRARADGQVRRGHGTIWGSIAGFTSFVAHAGGPPYQVYALPLQLGKTAYVATSVYFYAAINMMKLPAYVSVGSLDATAALAALYLLPLAPLGMWLGVKLHHIVPEAPFFRIAYALLFIAGIKLFWDGLQAVI